jgi:Fur family ferric uptake transcriptional regulator
VELYELVRRRLPKISLGTVYRNLDLLAEMGKIQKLDLSGGEARFDGNVDAHYHVRCIRCGRVDDLHGVPPRLVIDRPSEAAGYRILGHRLEFVGVCPHCQGRPERGHGASAQQEGSQSEACPSQP